MDFVPHAVKFDLIRTVLRLALGSHLGLLRENNAMANCHFRVELKASFAHPLGALSTKCHRFFLFMTLGLEANCVLVLVRCHFFDEFVECINFVGEVF